MFCLAGYVEKIPVSEALSHRGIMVQSSTCLLCGNHNESVNHLIVEFDFSKIVLHRISRWCGLQNLQVNTVRDLLDYVASWGNCPRKKNKHLRRSFIPHYGIFGLQEMTNSSKLRRSPLQNGGYYHLTNF